MRDGLINPVVRPCAQSPTRGKETNQRLQEGWLLRRARGRLALAANAFARGSARSTTRERIPELQQIIRGCLVARMWSNEHLRMQPAHVWLSGAVSEPG